MTNYGWGGPGLIVLPKWTILYSTSPSQSQFVVLQLKTRDMLLKFTGESSFCQINWGEPSHVSSIKKSFRSTHSFQNFFLTCNSTLSETCLTLEQYLTPKIKNLNPFLKHYTFLAQIFSLSILLKQQTRYRTNTRCMRSSRRAFKIWGWLVL